MRKWNEEALFAPRGRYGHLPPLADLIDVGDCWVWTGSLTYHGYGQSSLYGFRSVVHRLVWRCLVGPIPNKLVLDHLCRNRACCNTDHLRAVTQQENMMASPIRGGRRTLAVAA